MAEKKAGNQTLPDAPQGEKERAASDGKRSEMMREIPPFGLRIPSDLKARLKREARMSGRSLQSEILDRLRRTVDQQDMTNRRPHDARLHQDQGSYRVETDDEHAMIGVFRSLPPEKRLALLSLFK